MINSDFRFFTDMVDRWVELYARVPGARATVEEVVHEWLEQQLIETVMSAQALKRTGKWSLQELESLPSEAALTATQVCELGRRILSFPFAALSADAAAAWQETYKTSSNAIEFLMARHSQSFRVEAPERRTLPGRLFADDGTPVPGLVLAFLEETLNAEGAKLKVAEGELNELVLRAA